MKILLAEDSPAASQIITSRLKSVGAEKVVEAANGREALAQLKVEAGFDLVITDWNMPEMSGLELVKAIRADKKMARVPILMLTSRDQKKDAVDALKAGVNDYLLKPFDTPGLKEKIDKILSR